MGRGGIIMQTMPVTTWTEFVQTCVVRKMIPLQYTEGATYYDVYAAESGMFLWTITLDKGTADADDFAANYKHLCNYSVGMWHQPFGTDNLECAYDATDLVEITDAVHKIYFKITEDCLYLPGGQCIGENINLGDWFSMKIVDHDNILGYGVDFELKYWMKKRYLEPGGCVCKTPYVGNPPNHFYIMITYTKGAKSLASQTNPAIVINFDFHKKVL
jgi:hypothetical protein